jgi:hypothetical protein
MGDAPVDLRVGDRERRAIDEQLQAAVGDGVLTLAEYDERSAVLWQTRTRTELDALVRDLPSNAPPPSAPSRGDDRPQRVVAVMSEDRLFAPVQPGQEVRGWAVMGKAVLDLRREDLPSGTHVRVRSVMGEVEVQVPAGSTVHLSGMTLMGERKVEVVPGAGPQLHVDAYAVMGSVKVTVGDGKVVPAGQPAATSTLAPQRPAAVAHHRSGVLARAARKIAVLAVPVALVGALVVAGPDSAAVFGSSVERVGPGADVRVSALFGSLTVVVPDGTRVETSGVVVFGSLSCDAACQPAQEGLQPASGEVAQVRGLGGFGSIRVLTQSEYDAQREADRLEDLRDDADDD